MILLNSLFYSNSIEFHLNFDILKAIKNTFTNKDRVKQISKRYYQASKNCTMYVESHDHFLVIFENMCKYHAHNAYLLGTFVTIVISIRKNSENM